MSNTSKDLPPKLENGALASQTSSNDSGVGKEVLVEKVQAKKPSCKGQLVSRSNIT